MARIEAKKHGVKQLQGNDWVVTLVVSNEDFHEWGIAQDSMGTIYTMDVVSSEEEAFKAEYTNPIDSLVKVTTEGEKLRTRAVMLCEDVPFQEYAAETYIGIVNPNGIHACKFIYYRCGIKSRSELATNIEAQKKFKELDRQYKEWLNPIENQYADNLERY